MGTRGDFYIGRGKDAEWLGSTAWDSYPGGLDETDDGSRTMLRATTEEQFRAGVAKMASTRSDFTPASNGWPWPWDDSATTDYAYAFEDGTVYASGFGRPWFEVNPDADYYGEPVDPEDEGEPATDGPAPVFPNMRERKNVRLDEGSGLILVAAQETTVSASHPTRVQDPKGIKVSGVVNGALDRMMDDLDRLVHRGEATTEEVTSALGDWPDLQEAWENYLAEGDG